MLPTQDTRSGRRAVAHATAHTAVRSRRPHLVLGTALAAVLGATLTTGLVAAPAAAVEHRDAVASLVATTPADETGSAGGAVALAVPLAEITQEADATLADAQTAVADAEALADDVAASGLTLETPPATISTGALHNGILELSVKEDVPPLQLVALSVQTAEITEQVATQTVTVRESLTAAQEKKAAEEAAAAAAAERAAAERAAANTVDGAKATAREMAQSRYGWGSDQFSCLESLWNKESGWNYQAYNDSSGATGIPQALPGSKMATAGSDWKSNATTQIAWGLSYIDRAYGTPCSAWGHSQATDWY